MGTATVIHNQCSKMYSSNLFHQHSCYLTLAFCRTLPFVPITEAGLFFREDAELTGEAESALMLLLEGWDDEDDDDDV